MVSITSRQYFENYAKSIPWDDILFPEEYRGIGVRIEDDILVTESGAKILSNALPRHPDEVEAYMANLIEVNR